MKVIKIYCVISALRDLYVSMEKSGTAIPPIIFLQVLHLAYPQFAEKGEQGVYQQQVKLQFCLIDYLLQQHIVILFVKIVLIHLDALGSLFFYTVKTLR